MNSFRNLLAKMFNGWTMFEKVWLASFSLIGIYLCYQWGDTIFGLSVMLTGIVCVVLVTRGSIWNYAPGLYNAAGYGWIAYQNGYFGEVMLNIGYYVPAQLIGIYMWKKNLSTETTVVMRQMNKWSLATVVILSATTTYVYGVILSRIPDQNSPFFDSCSTSLSVIAMILMMMRFKEQWLLWIVVDIVSVAMWTFRLNSGVEGSTTMLVMWYAYLVNAIYGYYAWNKQTSKTI